jgi:hypothetical protein
VRHVLILTAVALSLTLSTGADLYAPDRSLSVIETEYFSFIFPEESRPAVEYLTGFADECYREIATLLGTSPRYHLPVVMTPDSEELNGYFTWHPYLKIVLYQAAIDPNSSLGSFNDDLKKLFYHELTHAVSLTIRSKAEDAIVSVFGSPLGASNYLTPLYFVEGVTVSFESLDGFGRAGDPYSGAMLRQDILEGRWKSPTQVSGAYDSYPSRNLYYVYGGYFSRYLQQRFGMETYAEIWKEFGATSVFRSLDDGLFRQGRFSRIFGIGLSEAWGDFERSMTPGFPVYMASERLRDSSNVSALSVKGSSLFYADGNSEAVYAYDTERGKERLLFRAGAAVSRIDVSTDGLRMLLSTQNHVDGFPRLMLKERDMLTGTMTTLAVTKMRDAAYLPDNTGLVGIAIDGYRTNIVIMRGNTSVRLLSGTERVAYASPVSSADGRAIYALARVDGITTVIRINLDDSGVTSVDGLVLPEELGWIRYLSMGDDGVLRFAWDDNKFYRLVELCDQSLCYQSVPISGGVHRPVESAGRVFYLGRFSDGIAPCAFPADRASLGFECVAQDWIDASGLLGEPSAYDTPPTRISRTYQPIHWLLPQFWLPTASLNETGIESAGLLFIMGDPVERLEAQLMAEWDFGSKAVDMDIQIAWKRFTAPVSVSLSDSYRALDSGIVQRSLSGSLGTQAYYPVFSGGQLSWSLSSGIFGSAWSLAGESANKNPETAAIALEASLSWDDTRSPLSDHEAASGYSLSLFTRLDRSIYPVFASPSAGIEATARAFLEPGAIALAAHGAIAASDGIYYGSQGRVYESGSSLAGSYPIWNEFKNDKAGRWYSQGELSLRLLKVELQRGIGAFYANRLSLRSGGRGYLSSGRTWSDGITGADYSVFGRATLTWTPVIGALAAIHPSSYLEAWCRPGLGDASSLPHGVTFMLLASY